VEICGLVFDRGWFCLDDFGDGYAKIAVGAGGFLFGDFVAGL
jgi:hypothetical protein